MILPTRVVRTCSTSIAAVDAAATTGQRTHRMTVDTPEKNPAEPKHSLKRLSVLRRLIGLMAPHKVRFALATISLLIAIPVGVISAIRQDR